ncbi:hypothetical protein ABC347_11290 [Sphingomonas sp. 1P06PA]|uniref:hypothetical protein n=1 Tax=Sphingomonas sp. 1P06PA TaxID=554121 RepID=UPI0039A74E01
MSIQSVNIADRKEAVTRSIARAASRTGVDFGYLLRQAKSESGLNPTAKATTSSASGLYQFIDQSWLGVLKQHGAKHGYGWASDAIERSGSRWTVRDPALRQAVFGLRTDADAASLMAGEFASDNADGLSAALGRTASSGDLYFAHFLGLAGAKRFLKAADANPDASAAALFPREAAANRSIFYTRDGSARTLGQVYRLMAKKVDGPVEAAPAFSPAIVPARPDGTDLPGMLMADGREPLTREPPGKATPKLDVDLAGLLTDGSDQSPLALMREADARRRELNILRPSPNEARLAYMMVLGSLG